MMMYLQVIGGFVILVIAAEAMVRGAVILAEKMGISAMVIGMTVVAFGTSAPELMVSLQASLNGSTGLALGNIVGSNIANVWLILGASCLVTPILVRPDAMKRDVILLMGGSLLFTGFCLEGELSILAGLVLLVVFAAFLGFSYFREKADPVVMKEHEEELEELEKGLPKSVPLAIAATVIGIAGLAFGADMLVAGGSEIARSFGVSEEVIGLTLFAFGTSLPELAASVVAAYRGHPDVAIGNVVGSNIFNMMLVGGIVSLVTPIPVPGQVLSFDIWVMLIATLMLLPVLLGWMKLDRKYAFLFFVIYIGYVGAQAYGVERLLAAI
ncbi:calcium/sodium antiporter [Thalassospiraceae bacterium LMO-JJ14]|nr:calcium/sodium antiporter [Thalassospiraceae bacterium LMO-JJ14]